MSIKVAIIGAGYTANEHAKSFAALPEVQLTAIHSRTRSKAETLAETYGITAVYDSVEACYTEGKADLVVVTVPETAMKTVASACLEYDWDVMLEKPPGITTDEAQALQATAEANRRRVWVALNRRMYSATQAALADLDENEQPRFIHVQDQQSLDLARSIGHPNIVVENWMHANSIHLVDYLTVFGRGDVTEVQMLQAWDPENPGVVLAHITFSSGDTGLYEGIWHGPGPWAVSVTTAARRWEMRPLEAATYQNQGERQRHDVEVAACDQNYKPGFFAQAQEVAQGAAGGSCAVPTLAEAIRTMQLTDTIFATSS